MPSQTNEQALEALIETALVGSSREERTANISEQPSRYGPGSGHGYEAGHPHDFDRAFAIDREKFWRFLESTQPAELDKLKARPGWERLLLERLDRKIKREGILHVLKSGLDIDDAHITLYYSLPFNDLNPDILPVRASPTPSPGLPTSL
jgi:type I restriction enzyme, R subunit